MATSLAQQLKNLKVKQKDEIVLPQRTKISFLFDIKKAANIDDQTLYFLCQSGIQELEKQAPQLHASLLNTDLFSENSLSFYRGTQTSDSLKIVDGKLEEILGLLAPYLLLPPTHKVFEYMVRIYEVHAHLKHSVICAFLAYFETSYFLKAMQLLNLKEDEIWFFLHEFAYQGQAIQKPALVKALARNQGVAFTKYAQWCLSTMPNTQEASVDALLQAQGSSNLHYKFVGVMLVEVLRSNLEDEVLMYNVLPSISQSLKSSVAELKHAGLLAIGQLCCRRALSKEYTRAFLRQTILTMKDSGFDEPLKERGLTVILMIIQYQNLSEFDVSDLSLFFEVPRIGRVLQRVSANFDVSLLIRAIVQTAISTNEREVVTQLRNSIGKLLKLKGLMTLKIAFTAISSILQHLLQNLQHDEAALELLKEFEASEPQAYNQTVLYHLKQTEDQSQKERLRQVLSRENSGAAQEQSFLSALGSNRKHVRIAALKALCSSAQIKQLPRNEASLVELFLSQLISRCQDDEELMEAMLEALNTILKSSDRTQEEMIFESLEAMINTSTQHKTYSNQILEAAVGIAVSLNVTKSETIQKQAALAYFFNKQGNQSSEFAYLLKFKGKDLEKHIQSKQEKTFQFVEMALSQWRAYSSLEKIDYLVSQILSGNRDPTDLTQLNQISRILSKMKKFNESREASASMLVSIIEALPTREQLTQAREVINVTEKCIRKIILITLYQKQMNSQFNLLRIHNLLQQRQFRSSNRLYCEFHIQTALKESSNSLKRVFSIMHLIDCTRSRFIIEPIMALSVLLMLLSDADSKVRSYAFSLAEAIVEQPEDKEVLEIFSDTEKPRSAKKTTKTGPTPLNAQQANQFLEELIGQKHEITQDQSQLKTFLDKTAHKEVLEFLLRGLLDFPTYGLKSKMIDILSLAESHSLTFSISLGTIVQRLFSLRSVLSQPRLGLESADIKENTNESANLIHGEMKMLCSLGKLVNQICQASIADCKPMVQALVLPLITHIQGAFITSVSNTIHKNELIGLEEILHQLSTQSIFKKEILAQLDHSDILKAVHCFLNLQKGLHSTTLRASIKATFIEESSKMISSDVVIQILAELQEKVSQSALTANSAAWHGLMRSLDLELTLETLLSMVIDNDYEILPSVLSLLQSLLATVFDLRESQSAPADDQSSTILSQLYFSIELSCQICKQIIENHHKTNAQALRVSDASHVSEELIRRCLDGLEVTVQANLEATVEDQDDPFNQFMQVVDADETGKSKAASADHEALGQQLMTQQQILKSLTDLLLKSEKSVDGHIAKSAKYLARLGGYIQGLQSHPDSTSMRYTDMTGLLFRFFHREVLKTVNFADGEEEEDEDLPQEQTNTRDVIGTYISTVVSIVTSSPENVHINLAGSNRIQEYLSSLQQMIERAGILAHSHTVVFLLLAHSRDNISIVEDLKMEGVLLSFARAILVHAIKRLGSLAPIQNLLLTLGSLPLSEKTLSFTDKKLKIVDKTCVSKALAVRTWLSSNNLISFAGQDIRRLTYVALYTLEGWLSADGEMKRELASIAGEEPSELVQEQFLNIYLILGIMKDGFSFYLQEKEQRAERQSMEAKHSIKRLSTRVDTLLGTLNEMLSHEIHASIVLKIMTLQYSDILSLKTNALQLLLNKTPEFQFQLSLERQTEMTTYFLPLIEEAINVLEDTSAIASIVKSTEKQTYSATLFALISKTACGGLPSSIKETTILLSLKYLTSQPTYPLTLNTQLLLTQTQLFEVYQADILEHLTQHVDHVLLALARALKARKEDEFFHESFTRAALKATLSICTMFSKFLNVQQLESLLKNVLVVDKAFQNEVESILAVVTTDGPQNSSLKQLFQAVFNCFDEVLIQNGTKLLTLQANLPLVALRFFRHLLKPMMTRMKKEFCTAYFQKISAFFREVFHFPQLYFKNNDKVDILQLEDVEEAMVQAFQQFVVKLNEDQLGPVIVQLVKWAKKAPKEGSGTGTINLHRQIILFKAMSGVVNSLGEYAVPFIQLQISNITEILGELIKTFSQFTAAKAGAKRTHMETVTRSMLEASSADGQGHTMLKLLTEVCACLTLNFRHDSGAFIQTDIFELLSEPLVAELVGLNSLGSHFTTFIDESLKPLVFEMLDRINNDGLWIRTNNAILMKTRMEHPWQVRRAALSLTEHLFAKMGERFLVVLNDTLPFLSESLEDEHPEVEMLAKEIVKKVETLTGETIQDYLK